jgi:predicted Zn-dependent protease with MMP-like domain
MRQELRDYFDRLLEQVLQDLPPLIHQLLEEVPLVVDDFPPASLRRKLGVRSRDALCGLYTGVPLTERSVGLSGIPSDVIRLFREGILSQAVDRRGQINEGQLREQIRITILHEVGHHFGLDEDDLQELGYG